MKSFMNQYLNRVSYGEVQEKDNLILVPVFLNNEKTPRDYLLLDEALDIGSIQVGEVSEGGSVNNLLVENSGSKAVLILDGEELVGAKQNRMVNATILIPPESKITIPVSCVEHGRWSYQGANFQRSEVFGYAELRRKKSNAVSRNLESHMSFASDQGEVWEEIGRKHDQMGTSSHTEAVHDVYKNYDQKLNDFIEGISLLEDQVGAGVFINGSFICMDLFAHHDVLSHLWKKLIKSYAMEALELQAEKKGRKKAAQSLEPILADLQNAEVNDFQSIGWGRDIRMKSTRFMAAGLVYEKNVLHLVSFQGEEQASNNRDAGSNQSEGNMRRPGLRRNNIIH